MILIISVIYYRYEPSQLSKNIVLIASLIISVIVEASLLFYLPNVETQITFYPLYYWAGTLITPITIAIIAVIFYRYKKHIREEIKEEIEKHIREENTNLPKTEIEERKNKEITSILTNRRRKFRHIAEAAILTASCIVAANLLLSLNTDTHVLRFWVGILIIPITTLYIIVIRV